MFTNDDVEIEIRDECYRGFCKVARYQLRHRLFEGGWSESISREIYERDNATCVLPYDPVRDEVVLVEQFRAGAMEGGAPWLLELVAGMNDGELPEQVARREAEEEAGLTVGALAHVCDYWVSPGGMSERVTLYCGQVDTTLAQAESIHGLKHEHEDIKVHVLSFDDVYRYIQTGRIDNAAAIMAIQWLALNRDRIREKWGADA